MKVTSIEIWDVNCESMPWHHPVLIRVNTDEGISGVGEVGLAFGTGHSGGAGYVKNLAEAFLLGADPMNTEKIWDAMFQGSFWAKGGGPVVYGGMSAIDIACWDIRGKALGQPVYQLLGGKTNENLRCYASQIQFGWDTGPRSQLAKPEEYARVARQVVSEGYDAVKVDPTTFDLSGQRIGGWNRILTREQKDLVYNRIKAIREAVGQDVDILIELHAATSATSAIQLGKLLAEFDCMFMEEAVQYVNPALQKKVAHQARIPLAAGERIYTRWGYAPYFAEQSLDMIQPDLCLTGGITEGKKVCDYAYVYDITVQVHVCGSPVSAAAALHLETVIPNFQIHEHHVVNLKPGNRELCLQDNQPQNGRFTVPEEPGLGVDLNDAVLAKSPCVTVE